MKMLFMLFMLLVLLSFFCATSAIVSNKYSLQKQPVLLQRSRVFSTIDSTNEINSLKQKLTISGSLKGLKADMFAHPLDTTVTKQLSKLPVLESLARRLFGMVEQAFVVENLSSSVLVSPQQMPLLHSQLVAASKMLDMDPPDLYVRQNPVPNAYTLAFRGRKPFIVVHTSLLDLLDEKEVAAVIGHELGHLKCEHGLWITVLNLLIESVDLVVGPVAPLRSLLLRWQRSAEYSCDRAALLCTRDEKVVASVLMKLCGGSQKNNFSKELSVDAFLDQAKKLEIEKNTISGRLVLLSNDQVATHPIPLARATELIKWHDSAQYRGLVKRSTTTQ